MRYSVSKHRNEEGEPFYLIRSEGSSNEVQKFRSIVKARNWISEQGGFEYRFQDYSKIPTKSQNSITILKEYLKENGIRV